jgi:DMSO/TMAO reductase YedYZ heme-binding membrane subunit
MPKTAVDTRMRQGLIFTARTTGRQSLARFLLRIPAFVPLIFISHALVTLNNNIMDKAEADVLGTGAEALLLLTLLMTPIITVTRQRWIAPLRRWYGIMFAVTAITDAIIASITTHFAGGVFGRIAGHSFLLAGLTMACLTIPLLATANNPAQRWLGKYWKQTQRMTYAIWALLFVHLTLLEGFGFQHGANGSGNPPDGDPIFHQRLYQLSACSIPLLILRFPSVKHWIGRQQKADREWLIYLTVIPLGTIFALGFTFIVNEEIFKGIGAFTLHPSDSS